VLGLLRFPIVAAWLSSVKGEGASPFGRGGGDRSRQGKKENRLKEAVE
jgi:hypothetical protein